MKRTGVRGLCLTGLLAGVWVVSAMTADAHGQITKACCLPNGNCVVREPILCVQQGGFSGRESTCAGVVCTGACCAPKANCAETSYELCASLSSTEFRGPGTTCAEEVCGGACCTIAGGCRVSNAAACAAPEIFHGLGSLCADVDCAGACCLPDKACVASGSAGCSNLGGEFQGLGSTCGDDCPTAMPTAFSYQGHLERNGAPVNGLVDMIFSLWLSPTGNDPANQVGGAVSLDAVEVLNGLFHVEIDFGQDAFNGNARWLQIELRDQGSSDPFTILSPRVPLNPAPYALQTRGIVVRQDGKVGIGTKQPEAGLHIKKEAVPPGGTLALEGDTHAYLTFFPDGMEFGRKGYFGFATPTTGDITIGNEVTNGRIKLATSGGTVLAAGGEENLRIVRGSVNPDGSILQGLGFSAEHTGQGTYTITFNPPFLGTPVITTSEAGSRYVGYLIIVNVYNVTATGATITIYTWNTDGGGFSILYVDSIGFRFIAVGPR